MFFYWLTKGGCFNSSITLVMLTMLNVYLQTGLPHQLPNLTTHSLHPQQMLAIVHQ
jgi:hypothetical protein